MKKTNKEMTIGELAIVMQKEFKNTNKRTDEKIDELAAMTQRGFAETNGRTNELKEEINIVREEESSHFATLKNILYRAHDNRIEKIEDDIRILKTALKM